MRSAEIDRAERYARIGMLLFIACALSVWAHLALGAHYWRFSPALGMFVDAFLGVLWTGAAIASGLRAPRAHALVVAGTFGVVAHACLVMVTLPWAGVPYLLASAVLLYTGYESAIVYHEPRPADAQSR